MATATVVQPSSAYPASASYSSNYPPSGSSMITSADSRRSADDGDSSKRQSLPSISEVISNTKSSSYTPTAQTNPQPSNSFPSPFSGPPRTYGEAEKHSSTQSMRQTTSFAPSREPLSSFADSPRNSYNSRPALPSPADRRASPSTKPELPPHHYPHEPPQDHRPLNGGYPQQAPQSASASAAN